MRHANPAFRCRIFYDMNFCKIHTANWGVPFRLLFCITKEVFRRSICHALFRPFVYSRLNYYSSWCVDTLDGKQSPSCTEHIKTQGIHDLLLQPTDDWMFSIFSSWKIGLRTRKKWDQFTPSNPSKPACFPRGALLFQNEKTRETLDLQDFHAFLTGGVTQTRTGE